MKIIITGCDRDNMIQEEEVLDKAGMTYTHPVCKIEDGLAEQAKGGEIIITRYGPLSRRVVGALRPELKLILRYGVGVNTINLETATQLGVQVCNVPNHGMNEVADQTMGVMLGLARKIHKTNGCTKYRTWGYTEAIPVHRILRSTVGVVGFGRVGCTFAKRMMGFDCRRIVCDPIYKEGSVHEGAEIVTLDTLLKESGMISVHCPLLLEIMNMTNMGASKKMKSTAYLVNTARGGTVDEGDLSTALQKKMITGAALDMISEELMEAEAVLFGFDNFLCSLHMAWYFRESALELERKIVEEAVRFAKGEPVMYPVDHL